jgi:hypothetical protein
MRRESSTVVALVGDVTGDLVAGLARSPNVSVARPPADLVGKQSAGAPTVARPAWETAAEAMRAAARRRSMYVIVPADPLADVAAAWQQMWDPAGRSPGALGFESSAAAALMAWRDKRFELPDYYLVMAPAPASITSPDLYLGPLRAVRPRRVAVAGLADSTVRSDNTVHSDSNVHSDNTVHSGSAVHSDSTMHPDTRMQTASLLKALRSLDYGPWWPPLDELLEAVRGFYAGGLAETQLATSPG